MTSLITRADDFGATPGSNDGILAALDGGAVRNVGLMACGPFLEHRLDELRKRDVCLGLHATLTSEWERLRWGPVLPASEVPSLVLDDGSFPPSTQVLAGQADPDHMIREVRAQLARLRELGLSIRYLDTHMVFDWVHGIEKQLASLCQEEGLVFGNDPRFGKMKCALSDSSVPTVDQLRNGRSGDGPAIWIFHPALPDSTGALPHNVAKKRHQEMKNLGSAGRLLERLKEAGFSPAAYHAVS